MTQRFSEYEKALYRTMAQGILMGVPLLQTEKNIRYSRSFEEWKNTPDGQIEYENIKNGLSNRQSRASLAKIRVAASNNNANNNANANSNSPTLPAESKSASTTKSNETANHETNDRQKAPAAMGSKVKRERLNEPDKAPPKRSRALEKGLPRKSGTPLFKSEQTLSPGPKSGAKVVLKKARRLTKTKPRRKKPALSLEQPQGVDDIFPLQIDPKDLVIYRDKIIGEGYTGLVLKAAYKGIDVACKCRRHSRMRITYNQNIRHELEYAAKLSCCRFINKYIGLVDCVYSDMTFLPKLKADAFRGNQEVRDVYVIQQYYENGDLREYLEKRGQNLHPFEVLQIAISLFAALTDAHKLDIGIVDLKLENILIDSAGSGWLTDFGSCVEFKGENEVYLPMELKWTKEVAAPEMIQDRIFTKKSDVFMATVILCEIMTPRLTDTQFYEQVVIRSKNGIEFRTDAIAPMYRHFLRLLKSGLHYNYQDRNSAMEGLQYLENMRTASFKNLIEPLAPLEIQDSQQEKSKPKPKPKPMQKPMQKIMPKPTAKRTSVIGISRKKREKGEFI
ncbi:kinase-like domain-containing protein [Phycomyces nitens]|nr:kinase-like domain-containing protein [Phycomyces nitens]